MVLTYTAPIIIHHLSDVVYIYYYILYDYIFSLCCVSGSPRLMRFRMKYESNASVVWHHFSLA